MAWTSPRTWVASEVVTAAIMNSAVRDNLLALNGFVLKGADESRTSTAVLANDAALSYAIPAAGTYVVDLTLFALSAANAAGDLAFGWAFPTGTMHMASQAALAAIASGTTGSGEWGAKLSLTSGTTTNGFGLSTSVMGNVTRAILIASAAGTLQLMWAQRVSNANASTVKAGSFMTVRQVA